MEIGLKQMPDLSDQAFLFLVFFITGEKRLLKNQNLKTILGGRSYSFKLSIFKVKIENRSDPTQAGEKIMA